MLACGCEQRNCLLLEVLQDCGVKFGDWLLVKSHELARKLELFCPLIHLVSERIAAVRSVVACLYQSCAVPFDFSVDFLA